MDPGYFKPIAVYLDENNALAVLYIGEVDGIKIELAIDRDRVALSFDSPSRSVLMGYHIADQTLFVNRKRSGSDRLAEFQGLVDQIQLWGQGGQVSVHLVPRVSESDNAVLIN